MDRPTEMLYRRLYSVKVVVFYIYIYPNFFIYENFNNFSFIPDEKSSDIPIADDAELIRDRFSRICNNPLPFDHSASWEVLVSKQHIMSVDSCKVPVLFRVHHSLGDGIALLRLYLETVADRDAPKRDYWAICSKSRPSIYKLFKDGTVLTHCAHKSVWTIIGCYISRFKRVCVDVKEAATEMVRMAIILFSAPASLINQSVYQHVDVNELHCTTELSGEKIIAWYFETECDGDLITKIKSIKHNFVEARFSDIFLSALSISLEKYFASKKLPLPKYMTAVIPARIAAEGILYIIYEYLQALVLLIYLAILFSTQRLY